MLSFGLAAATGAALGPIDVGAPASHTASGNTDGSAQVAELSGLTWPVASSNSSPKSSPSPLMRRRHSCSEVTSDGSPVTGFDILHERRLHLIVLSRNLIDYLHLHPTMDASGSRQVTIPPPHPGSYRVYADVQATGADRITLGTDIQVPDPVPSVALPAVSATAEIDGYHVSMSGVPVAGASTIEFDISLDGQVVVTEPYLGAAGHLVVIRTGDLGYLRFKPLGRL